MKRQVDETKVKEAIDDAKKDLQLAETHKSNTIRKLATDLKNLGMKENRISREIKKALVPDGFVTARYIELCLNPEEKNENMVREPQKKKEPQVIDNQGNVVNNTGNDQNQSNIWRSSSPNSAQKLDEPEPVYNQGQTVVPEQIDESKAPDQGIITGDDSNIQYYDAEKEELRKEIATLRTELAQARIANIDKPTDEKMYKFPLQTMVDICNKHIEKGSVKGYLIIRNGKLTGIRAVNVSS